MGMDSPGRKSHITATLEIVVGPPIRNFRTPAKTKYVLHIRIEAGVDKINTTCW
jgi:hypothetical protein